jgi:hypothetical protein
MTSGSVAPVATKEQSNPMSVQFIDLMNNKKNWKPYLINSQIPVSAMIELIVSINGKTKESGR